MKITCGNDIIEIDRIQKAIEEMGEQFIQRIYTQKEISYCKEKKNNQSNYTKLNDVFFEVFSLIFLCTKSAYSRIRS